MHYRAVLFDFDGTLTPSLPLWVKAFHIALRDFSIEVEEREIVRRFFYRDWGEVARELGIQSEEVLQKAIHRGLREAFQDAILYPEVTSVLKQVRHVGLQIALVTSAPKFILDDALPRLGLRSAFDHIVCADDVENHKPHPEPILSTLAALRCSLQDAMMIGDSTADILAGKAAGTATALFMPDAETTYQHVEALRATEPDHIFSEHGELLEILGVGAR